MCIDHMCQMMYMKLSHSVKVLLSRFSGEIPNQNSSSQAIALHLPINGKAGWTCHLPSKEHSKEENLVPHVVNNRTLMVTLSHRPSEQTIWFGINFCIKCGSQTKSSGGMPPFVNEGWNLVEFVSYHQWKAHCKNTPRFLMRCWLRVSNDISVTVTSCWGPAVQILWLGFSRIKRESPNQNSCSQVIALHPPVNGDSDWNCHLHSVNSILHKHPFVSLMWCGLRVSNDVSVTVTSCWGSAKQTLWLAWIFSHKTWKSKSEFLLAGCSPPCTLRKPLLYKHPFVSLMWCGLRVPNDVSVRVSSCWRPAKQTLWFGVYRKKSEFQTRIPARGL